jgi:hypothetical protein
MGSISSSDETVCVLYASRERASADKGGRHQAVRVSCNFSSLAAAAAARVAFVSRFMCRRNSGNATQACGVNFTDRS